MPRGSTKSASEHRANVSRLNGAGGGRPTAAEMAKKRLATKINRGVYLDLVREKRARVNRHLRAMKFMDDSETRELTAFEIQFIHDHRMTNLDLSHVGSDLADRYGDPRLSKQEIDLMGTPPVLIKIDGGLGWPKSEGRDAGIR